MSRPLQTLFTVFIFLSYLSAGTSKKQLRGQERDILWKDEFNGKSLREDYWSYDDGELIMAENDLELLNYVKNSVRVENGVLTISAIEMGHLGVLSGRIKTENKIAFQYGTVEAKIKVSGALEGLSPTFWTRGFSSNTVDKSVGIPSLGQINIFRTTPGNPEGNDIIRGITGVQWEGNQVIDSYETDFGTNLTNDDDYHVYKLDWTPRRLATYVDKQLVWEMDISDTGCIHCKAFHRPHFILLSLAVIFSNQTLETKLLSEMSIDYLRIYDNGFSIVSISSPSAV
jgi:beta-glucanase (GH16 family)